MSALERVHCIPILVKLKYHFVAITDISTYTGEYCKILIIEPKLIFVPKAFLVVLFTGGRVIIRRKFKIM